MDFKRLRILRELADRGTVGATAEAMGVTPSAVSQQLKTLQDELGVVLVEKSGRGVRLTEAGLGHGGGRGGSVHGHGPRGSHHRHLPAGLADAGQGGLLPQRRGDVPARASCTGSRPSTGCASRPTSRIPGVAGFAGLPADYDIVLAHSVDGPDVFARRGLVVVPLLNEPLDVAIPAGHVLAAKRA